MISYNVVIAADQEEANEFAAWLAEQGHVAVVGNTTATTIDGEIDNATSNELWLGYCAT